MLRHLYEGGIWFMLPIYLMYAVNLVLLAILLAGYIRKQQRKNAKRMSEAILFFGSFAFLLGILGQAIGIMQALDAIQAAGDVSLGLMAGGFKVSMIAPMYGFMLFIVSFLVWFVYRSIGRKA
ncbi:MotA/TolQ/ExbB proton channel family protein [Roseimarinus sediminis]|jgi:biopolymer transport protein ExbB/TolQ|uniref:MotA/TolQ/ExbB proton channel family protein n=1 Tax=Roseimarinus sediminis TaxID=1610899 RepID=UPI003D23AB02